MEKKKNKIQKYTSLYMSVGLSCGVALGVVYGLLLFSDNLALGVSMGLVIGMSVGMAIGSEKDKRLEKNMMKIIRVEYDNPSTDVIIYVVDKNEVEKEYKISEKTMKREKFSVGSCVAEDKKNVLVSLERNRSL